MRITYNHFKLLLEKLNLAASIVEPTIELPKPHLTIHRKAPHPLEEELFHVIIHSPDDLTAFTGSESQLHTIEYVYYFASETHKEAIWDTLLLINRINKVVPLTGFGFDEFNHKVYYRTVFPVQEQNSDKLLQNSTNLILDVLDVFRTAIELVSAGKIKYTEFIRLSEETTLNNLANLFNIKI